ncbi:hypothetical protein BACCOP_02750 [Phocaeicola coprocola DSM 17136]|uniref:Uncharacterized protein n=4 Tax=Bacteroidaceae TaxID=815 RepID=B3JL95_9BACT|nr:hypothetical protein BACCOP_02750 [Phocaeicola coprocola DSM 17136]RYU14030.1 hypothetical protein EAJ01_21595 [Bacteroides cellulosilyticus]
MIMDDFKIDIFEQETGNSFPLFYTLNKKETCNLYNHFCDKMNIKELHVSSFELFQRKGVPLNDFNALNEEFKFMNLLSFLKVNCDFIFINWDNFQTIDKMCTQDFSNYFYDIWFPSSDDILLFSFYMDFIIMIRHDGVIYYIK